MHASPVVDSLLSGPVDIDSPAALPGHQGQNGRVMFGGLVTRART